MKNGTAIEVTYQAAGATTGLDDVKMDVYDEAHAIDVGKGVAAMTEIGVTGRYYATFTPDAEGEWQVHIDSVTTPGKVVKHYTVVGHDVDSVGDAVAGLNDISPGDVDTALATYDAPTKAELDSGLAGQNDISTGDVATELATYDAPTKAELDTTETNIRGADSDTLKSISDQIDGLPSATGSPPMIG